MEQIQNNRVITDLYRENAQFPGIALDGSDVYLCWQRFVDRHDSLMASCRRGDKAVWEREISDGGEVLHPVILAHGGTIWYAWSEYGMEPVTGVQVSFVDTILGEQAVTRGK